MLIGIVQNCGATCRYNGAVYNNALSSMDNVISVKFPERAVYTLDNIVIRSEHNLSLSLSSMYIPPLAKRKMISKKLIVDQRLETFTMMDFKLQLAAQECAPKPYYVTKTRIFFFLLLLFLQSLFRVT